MVLVLLGKKLLSGIASRSVLGSCTEVLQCTYRSLVMCSLSGKFDREKVTKIFRKNGYFPSPTKLFICLKFNDFYRLFKS